MNPSPWTHLWRWGMGVAVFTFAVVVAGGTAVWRLERDAPGGNLTRWGDCLWWAITTLTTVGYGEHFPVTIGGRLVAVMIMVVGIAVIGAVAAIIAFGFASRLAQRLEAAVRQVENQVEQVEAEVENLDEQGDRIEGSGHWFGRRHASGALQELSVSVPDQECAASLTWLLARLGWHPTADDAGLGWRQGGIRLRLAVRPWETPVGIQGRLTFGAGSTERLARIARESARHGFHALDPPRTVAVSGLASSTPVAADVAVERVVLRTVSGFEVALVTS